MVVVVVGTQLRNEKSELEGTLAREQEHQMEKLLKHIERLQNEVCSKQETLDQVAAPSSVVFRQHVIVTWFWCVLHCRRYAVTHSSYSDVWG